MRGFRTVPLEPSTNLKISQNTLKVLLGFARIFAKEELSEFQRLSDIVSGE